MDKDRNTLPNVKKRIKNSKLLEKTEKSYEMNQLIMGFITIIFCMNLGVPSVISGYITQNI